jgi:hypothetical protein
MAGLHRGDVVAVMFLSLFVALMFHAYPHGYVLAAVFSENPYDTHHNYLRSDLPESADTIAEPHTAFDIGGHVP